MDTNIKILDLMAGYLKKKDSRTISKLKESHPELYGLFSLIGAGSLEEYLSKGTLGVRGRLFSLTEKEMLDCLESLSPEAYKQKQYLLEEIEKLKEHTSFSVEQKMNNFYEQKVDGAGLANILIESLKSFTSEEDSKIKEKILKSISAYKTSLKRLEVSKHKVILSTFIEENLSEYECEILYTLSLSKRSAS